MVAELENYYAQYDEAAKDVELLEAFWDVWGKGREKACRNMRSYYQYQDCGYNEEPKFDKYGWIVNDIEKDKVESIRLFGDEPLISTVECLQLPNGKWIGGHHYMLSEQGSSCSCSIWSKQYDSRIEALTSQMRVIADAIKGSKKQSDKVHLAAVVHAMDDVRQLSLF